MKERRYRVALSLRGDYIVRVQSRRIQAPFGSVLLLHPFVCFSFFLFLFTVSQQKSSLTSVGRVTQICFSITTHTLVGQTTHYLLQAYQVLPCQSFVRRCTCFKTFLSVCFFCLQFIVHCNFVKKSTLKVHSLSALLFVFHFVERIGQICNYLRLAWISYVFQAVHASRVKRNE